MTRTVDFSGRPKRAIQYLLASSFVLGALVFAGVVLAGLLGVVGVTLRVELTAPVLAGVAVLWLVLTVFFVRRLRRGDGDWWGPVPPNQYVGRFAGHGGLARSSWERAVRQLPGRDDEE